MNSKMGRNKTKSSGSVFQPGFRSFFTWFRENPQISTILSPQSRCQFHQRFTRNFYARRSRKCKKIQLSHEHLFTLLGSAGVKTVHRMLMKLTLGMFLH